MHTAILNGRINFAEKLLSARVLLQDLPFCPLHESLLDAHVEMVRWLIAKGVRPDEHDYLALRFAIDHLERVWKTADFYFNVIVHGSRVL